MKKEISSNNSTTNYINLERLNFLVDGVFAITMTLLVLELRLPDEGISNLYDGLLAMLPRLYIYLIAFYTIANHWVIQQRMFRNITSMDPSMLWLTILGLLFITLIPASTAIVGRFPSEILAAACFSVNSFFHALINWIFWAHVVKNHDKFAGSSDPRLLGITARIWMMISFGWLISIGFGFINIDLMYICWVLWPNLAALWGKHQRKVLATSG